MTGRIGFATWVSDAPTGGNRYDQELTAGLRRLGTDVREHRMTGPWPRVGTGDRQRLAETLARERVWLVDGIVAGAAPEVIEQAVAEGRRVVVVVHMLLGDEVGLSDGERVRVTAREGRALRSATVVITTSRWTADRVADRYGRRDAVAAPPGADPAPPAPGTGHPPRLLCLATLSATKDQLTLVRALAALRDRPWSCRLVGGDDVEPEYTAAVVEAVDRAGLADRVRVTGARTGSALEREWRATDLLVLASRTETFGLVVVEALARGVPSVVPADTGAVEAQGTGARPGDLEPPGAAFPAGDARALAMTLRRWLTEEPVRSAWRQAARRRRHHLPGWSRTCELVAAGLGAATGPQPG